MRISRIIGLTFLFMLAFISTSHAIVIYEDDFTTDTNQLTEDRAYYDRHNHMYLLPKQPLPNAIQIAEYGNEYVVINGNRIQFYHYDGGLNRAVAYMEIPITNPLGIALRQDQRSMWALTEDRIVRYEFTGTSMVENPALNVLGINNVISIATQPYDDILVTLEKDSSDRGIVRYYQTDAAGNLLNTITFNTGITNPVSISAIPNSYDFMITTETETHYYSFTGSGFTKNNTLSILGIDKAIAGVQDEGKLTLIHDDKIERYLFTGSDMVYATMLSHDPSHLSKPIAVSSAISNYDFAYLTDEGEVHYFMFDGTKMVRVDSMSITGLTINGGYLHPRYYQSPVIPTAQNYNIVRLTTVENNDPDTSITYEVSSDGGSTWTPVVVGEWTDVPDGSQFVVRATFNTSNDKHTPRLISFVLEATRLDIYDLIVTDIVMPPDPDQVLPTTDFPVHVSIGTEFTFEVTTQGYVDTLTAYLDNGRTVDMELKDSTTAGEEFNTWVGKYVVALDEPKHNIVGVSFTAKFGAREFTKDFGPFYRTSDVTVAMLAGIKLVE